MVALKGVPVQPEVPLMRSHHAIAVVAVILMPGAVAALCACRESAGAGASISQRVCPLERNPIGADGRRLRLSNWAVLHPQAAYDSGRRGDGPLQSQRETVMGRDQGPFKLDSAWPRLAWWSAAALVSISVLLGFVVLARYSERSHARYLQCDLPRDRHHCRQGAGGRATAAAAHPDTYCLDQRYT
jgi:hypothetical protein